ncbi:MAG: DNA gyrase subunit A [Planctomyces sp.]|nr:DNA gyrase subunit A [Planctomyces sp.]
MRESYLTYAMSVIVSRALPDARDGLKPSQRRILVAMNDANLGPSSQRKKCAKISGDTSGNYHPHGDGSVYPTLVRLAQGWVMRNVLVDKQGNFGSLAGLPPAAMRYTEARLSAAAAEMLKDLERETVDYIPNYDQTQTEPVVLPSRFPNLLVNGSSGIAVGMATSIPPHNLGEVCDAVVAMIDNPFITVDEIMEYLPAPDFPTGGIICGRLGVMQGYKTGRSTITVRAKTHFETEKKSDVIVVTEIPYLETRDRIREKLEQLVRDNKVEGISRIVDLTDRNVPDWQVHLQIVLKRDADKEVVLNQLYKYSTLQTTFSIILLALVGNRPKTLTILEMVQEFLRHRVEVIRRRTEYLLRESRNRKHTVEGLLIAQLDIDKIIQTIRNSASRAEAKDRLQEIKVPAEMVQRALGDDGFKLFLQEKGQATEYSLSQKQSEAIVSMQLGSLANLERENLQGEYLELISQINEYLTLLSDEDNIRAVVKEDMLELKKKFADKRRTEISSEELNDVNREDLIPEETMVVTLSQRGYIKRTALSTYQAQGRGGKGIRGAQSDDEDAIQHLFVSSTHAYLLFFTDRGKVYWQKVYDLPLQSRTSKGRAVVNLLALSEEEQVQSCIAIREFDENHFLMMATRNGTIKKTDLAAYSRPMKGGIIAIRLDDDDHLINVAVVSDDDDVVLTTANGMAIRFDSKDARSMGRATRGVRGINLGKGDYVVGMAVADEDMTLLSTCVNGYGKRTPFGSVDVVSDAEGNGADVDAETDTDAEVDGDGANVSSNMRYRRQRRGGKGLRDIRTTERNGKVVTSLAVADDDEILMVTQKGKIQRIRANEINQIGRNTQGVRIMRMDEGDALASVARIPAEFADEGLEETSTPVDVPPASETPANEAPTSDASDSAPDVESAGEDTAEE